MLRTSSLHRMSILDAIKIGADPRKGFDGQDTRRGCRFQTPEDTTTGRISPSHVRPMRCLLSNGGSSLIFGGLQLPFISHKRIWPVACKAMLLVWVHLCRMDHSKDALFVDSPSLPRFGI